MSENIKFKSLKRGRTSIDKFNDASKKLRMVTMMYLGEHQTFSVFGLFFIMSYVMLYTRTVFNIMIIHYSTRKHVVQVFIIIIY